MFVHSVSMIVKHLRFELLFEIIDHDRVGVRLCQRDSGCVWLGVWNDWEQAVAGVRVILDDLAKQAITVEVPQPKLLTDDNKKP